MRFTTYQSDSLGDKTSHNLYLLCESPRLQRNEGKRWHQYNDQQKPKQVMKTELICRPREDER